MPDLSCFVDKIGLCADGQFAIKKTIMPIMEIEESNEDSDLALNPETGVTDEFSLPENLAQGECRMYT